MCLKSVTIQATLLLFYCLKKHFAMYGIILMPFSLHKNPLNSFLCEQTVNCCVKYQIVYKTIFNSEFKMPKPFFPTAEIKKYIFLDFNDQIKRRLNNVLVYIQRYVLGQIVFKSLRTDKKYLIRSEKP